ncbi:MAG: type II secretion system F family protein [Alphaproteobacteria bacterium]|nr:type II secretion system F family protein [Alphaproteobacteria bacterium]
MSVKAKSIPNNPAVIAINQTLVKWDNTQRLKIYYKLAALLRNRFTVMDALDRIWDIESKDGKKPDEPFAIAVASWLHELEKGFSFSSAIDGWAPAREQLMLSVGDASKLEKALLNLIKVSEGSNKIIAPLKNAITYPLVMICLCFLIIVGVGLYMVPPMMEIVEGAKFTGVAGSLQWLSEFTKDYWFMVPIGLFTLITIITISLPNWTGKIRVLFDKFPPWSLYRMFTGVSWLLSVSALIESGTPIVKGLQSLRTNSTPYLRERIDAVLRYMNNGASFGGALKMSGMGFPDPEIVGDLEIYSELDGFEESLQQVADEYLEESIKNINAQAQMLNSFAMLLVSIVIAWTLFGVFEMQNQVQKAMS